MQIPGPWQHPSSLEAHASGRRIEILAHMSQFKNPFMFCCFRWNRCFSTPDKVVRYANRTKKVTLASSPRRTAVKKGGKSPLFNRYWAAISGF